MGVFCCAELGFCSFGLSLWRVSHRHAADYQSLTRRHALRIRLCPVHRKTEYRFSEREGWHLGTPTPRPQETGWHSLQPQGPHAAAWALSLRVALAYTATTLLHSLHLFPRFGGAVSHRGRPPCRLRLSQWAASVALLHH